MSLALCQIPKDMTIVEDEEPQRPCPAGIPIAASCKANSQPSYRRYTKIGQVEGIYIESIPFPR